MYVFTDAGPKDASDEFIEEVKYLASAEEYGVTINFFTTGKECNDRLVTKIVHKIIVPFSATKRRNVPLLCKALVEVLLLRSLGKKVPGISSSE